ncbi:MAG: hypothetical protein ACREP6_06745, partial [Candidatus Binataceae bacterium]
LIGERPLHAPAHDRFQYVHGRVPPSGFEHKLVYLDRARPQRSFIHGYDAIGGHDVAYAI